MSVHVLYKESWNDNTRFIKKNVNKWEQVMADWLSKIIYYHWLFNSKNNQLDILLRFEMGSYLT